MYAPKFIYPLSVFQSILLGSYLFYQHNCLSRVVGRNSKSSFLIISQVYWCGSKWHTYTGHGARPGWKRAGRRGCSPCICRRRPCADPHSRWRGRASGASPRLQWKMQLNKNAESGSPEAGAQEMTGPITGNQRAAKWQWCPAAGSPGSHSRNRQTTQRSHTHIHIIFNNKRSSKDEAEARNIISLTFHFYGNCLKFLLRLYSFTLARPLLLFMILICVASGCLVARLTGILLSGLLAAGSRVLALMHNLTVGQNIIFAAPSHIRHWITRGRALDAHRRALLDLQMSAGANVMNPRWHCQANKQRRERKNTLEMAKQTRVRSQGPQCPRRNVCKVGPARTSHNLNK